MNENNENEKPTKESKFKEFCKKRWLLLLAYFFQLVVPFIIILFIVLQSKEITHFKLSAGIFICGIGYICFISKFVKEKIRKLKEGVAKVVFTKLDNLIPLIVVAILVYLVQTCLKGFDFVFYSVIASVILGSILEMMEYALNKEYIYRQKLMQTAQEQVDLDKAKEELKKAVDDYE